MPRMCPRGIEKPMTVTVVGTRIRTCLGLALSPYALIVTLRLVDASLITVKQSNVAGFPTTIIHDSVTTQVLQPKKQRTNCKQRTSEQKKDKAMMVDYGHGSIIANGGSSSSFPVDDSPVKQNSSSMTTRSYRRPGVLSADDYGVSENVDTNF
jgi:hypothetical protein